MPISCTSFFNEMDLPCDLCLMDFAVDEIEAAILMLLIVSRASNTYDDVD